MKRLSIFVFIFSFVVAQGAHAETPVVSGTPTYSQPQIQPSAGINKTAKSASSLAMVTQLAGGIVATKMFTKCVQPSPVHCALGAAAAAGAVLMGKGSSNAGQVAQSVQSFSPGSGYDSPSADGGSFDTGDGGSFVLPETAAIDRKFRDAGYVTSADGSSMTLPNGQTVSTDALASGQVPGFEMTDDIKAEAAAIAEDAMKKASGAKVVAIGLQDGGGGGGGDFGAPPAEAGSRFNMADYLKGLRNRDPSSVSGLSKKLGEDNIGIKSDNIFEMVSRQYKRKQGQRAFMN